MKTYLNFPAIHFLGIISMMSIITISCKKDQDIVSPDFDVTVGKTTYAVNEPITFDFTGDADIISFYSGAQGSEYKYRDRFRVDGTPQLQFTSYYQSSSQENTLQLLISNDFSGTYDTDNVQNATWTDITPRATLSTGANNTPSGVIDLTDLQTPDIPVYLAFRYAASHESVQPTWTIKDINVSNKLDDGSSVSVATIANLSWGAVNRSNSAKGWAYNATQLQFTSSPAGTEDNDDWLISQPIQLDRVQRSFGVNIKNNPVTKQTSYEFAGYAEAGTYTVTFEAINANKWDKKTVVKEMAITVQ